MFNKLVRWARITKASTDDKQFPVQQMEYLGKVADGIIVFPYGVHANVPADSLALMFAVEGNPENRAAIAWTPKDRPTLKDGEVAFYHPPTDAFIIWKQNGDLDIETGNGGTGNVNINCKQANVTASESVNVDSPITNLGVGGPAIARLGDAVEVTVTGGSSAGTYSGTITGSGVNTSI